MMSPRKYHMISDGEPSHALLEIETPSSFPQSEVNGKKRRFNTTGAAVFVLFLCVSNVMIALVVNGYWTSGDVLLRKTSVYSPVFDRVHIPLIKQRFDPALDPSNKTKTNHLFLQPRGPETDAAWDHIADVGIQSVTHDELLKLGRDPEHAIQPPESWGFDGGYMAEIDVFHQLHCLNALRKGLVTNYQHYWGKRYGLSPPVNFEQHLMHCLDMLRQNIMCHADVEAITYVWRDTQVVPFPEFGVEKVCRDFEVVREWNANAKLKDAERKWDKFKKPADANQLPAPEGIELLKPERWVHHGNSSFDTPIAPLQMELPQRLDCEPPKKTGETRS